MHYSSQLLSPAIKHCKQSCFTQLKLTSADIKQIKFLSDLTLKHRKWDKSNSPPFNHVSFNNSNPHLEDVSSGGPMPQASVSPEVTHTKNVLQEWHAYIRKMVQFHVLGEMFDSSLLHPGVPHGVPGTLVPNCMGSCHGQIFILYYIILLLRSIYMKKCIVWAMGP